MKTSTKLLSMFSAFCAFILIGLTANAQSITVTGGLTANQMAQALVGSNVTVTNATLTGAAGSSGSFSQGTSTFPLTDGIILTSGSINNALGPNNSTGASTSNGTPGDTDLNVLVPGFNTFDACVLEFDVTSNCNTLTFDYIFASEEYVEYGCSNFNDAFGFLISGPGFAPNTNIALVPGTSTPVSINNVINSPATNCVSNPSYYVDNSAGVSVQYDGYTVTMVATATIQPCQTYHVKIVVGDAGDSALDSAIFLKGGGINCSSPSLMTTANVTPKECGVAGAIDISVNSGTGPFTYAWTGPNGFTATTEDLTGLAPGDYTVDIVGSDCLSSGQFTYTVVENADVTAPVFTNCPSDLIIDAANNACGFSVNVLANINATDDCGVTSLTTSHDSTFVFELGTTPVTITATDAAGNTSTCNFNVIVNAQPLEVTLVPVVYNGGVNIRCYGQNSGNVSAGATGGCAPYTYTWSAGFAIPPSGSTCVGLFAGLVTCTVTDASGASVTGSVMLTQNPPVTVTASWTPILCYGGSSTVTLNAQAGSSPYNGTVTTANVIPGTYEYVISDANGCRAYDTIVITQPDILEVTAIPEPILCYGDSTDVAIAATGGTMPYTGVGVVTQLAGVYNYSVVDANGCTDNVQLAINQPNALSASVSATPILCNGGLSQVTVSVASGTEPYTGTGQFWVQAGWHTYTVYDFNLCEDTISILITEPSAMSTTITATPIACAGGTTDITITGAGGTGVWNGPGTYTQNAGTFGYTMTDANGCTDSVSITVSEPSQLTMSLSSTGIDCFGGMADVVVTAAGGTPSYTGTGTFSTGPGTFVYSVTDANGCTVSDSITITEPSQMTAYVTCPGILCNGGTADIAVTAFGGTPSYTGDGVFTVYAGTDTYTVTDANGCTASVTHTVTEPAALVVSITSSGIDCNGGTTDVTVTGTGGTSPYTGEGTFNVTAGTYTYSLTDANGCTADTTITVTEPTVLIASASADSILCNGGSADVTVTATGGTAPYIGTGTSNLTAGTYDYTITDANGCTATTSITLTEPTLMTAYASCPGILCNGGTTDLAVTAFGGMPPYSGTGVFTVGAGTYTYTITDANGCTATVTHTITEPAPLVVSITSSGIDCNGGTTDVTVTGTGGTSPYTGEGTFNVTAGTYTYSLTDANGCTADTTITVTEPAVLVASASAAAILCNGGSTDVTVTATGGTAPYTGTGTSNLTAGTYDYTITDANGCTATTSITLTEPSLMTAYASCPVIDCNGGTADMAIFAFGGMPPYSGTGVFNVGAGTYTYTITDANGCTASVTHTVTEPAALVVSITSSGIDCNGGTADLTVTASGGTAPYTGEVTASVTAGTYDYTVTDANGCSTTESITVTEPTVLVASASADSILCNGGSADVTVTATGGTAPYTGTGTSNLTAGTYDYTITDANGCTATTSITLTEPTLMTAYASCPGILCNGGTTDLAVTAFGGMPPYSGTGVFTVSAGTYTYTITDANGCTASVTHTITEPAPLVVSITSSGIDCNGGTADLTVTATGGTTPYTGVGTFNVTTGTYDYTVTDANGCSTTESITVAEPTQLSASISATSILCNGGTSDVTVTATGGTAPYTGTGVTALSAGTHTVTVTDANGCSVDVTITVTEPTQLVATISATAITCFGGTSDVTVTATGGTTPYTGTGVSTLSAGTHTVTVTDANGCSVDVTITVTEPTQLAASISATTISCNGGTSDVTVTATGGTAPYTGTGVSTLSAGTHTVTVTDANGCSVDVTITVTEPTQLVATISATSILCNGGTADITVSATGGLSPYTGTGVYSVSEGTYSYTVMDANGCSVNVSTTVVEPTQLTATATVATLDCSTLTSDVTIVAAGGNPPYTGTGSFDQSIGSTTYTITDANGCTVTVVATVEVESFVDLTCPGDQTYDCNYSQNCGSQNTGSWVSWDEPTASSFSSCDNGCGPSTQICGFIFMGEFNGSRYYCSNSSNYSWQAANTAANNAGGHLATIQSAAENQFVSSQIMANEAWIGLTDQNTEGVFEWANGESLGYTNWSNYEPNNNGPTPNSCTPCGEADYTVVRASNSSWYDRYECNQHEFVMEIPCGNPITITQTSGPSNGTFLQGGTSEVVTYVAVDDVTGETATCSFTVTVEECTPVYCESEASCTAYEWIDQVTVGSINNQSGNDGGYGDYTSLVTIAAPADIVNLQLTPGFSGSSYTEAWRVWVDWNYDGDFNDQGEMVYQGSSSSVLNSSFTVPSYAVLDKNLRVRVSMRWNCYAGPCSSFQYGEVEDYTIFVQGGSDKMILATGQMNGSSAKQGNTVTDNIKMYEDVIEDGAIEGGVGLELGDIYPNPVLASNGTFNLDIRTGSKTDVTIRIIDLAGKVMLTDFMLLETGANKRTMDVTGFARGSYLIEVVSGSLRETTQLIVQ